jgi:hypothetical protein
VDDLLILYSHVISNIPPVFLLCHDRGPRLRAEMYANIFNSLYRPSERQSMYVRCIGEVFSLGFLAVLVTRY